MRLWPGAFAAMLAGCAVEGTTDVAAPDRAAEVGACAAAVAEHIGKPVDAVEAAWTGESTTGIGVVTVRDDQAGAGERVHTCEIDASGRVLALRHPGA